MSYDIEASILDLIYCRVCKKKYIYTSTIASYSCRIAVKILCKEIVSEHKQDCSWHPILYEQNIDNTIYR